MKEDFTANEPSPCDSAVLVAKSSGTGHVVVIASSSDVGASGHVLAAGTSSAEKGQ